MSKNENNSQRFRGSAGSSAALRLLPLVCGVVPALAAAGAIFVGPRGQWIAEAAGAGAICSGLGVALGIWLRKQLGGMEVVGDSLGAFAQGERSPDALKVNPRSGPVATAFNALMEEYRGSQRRAVVEKMTEPGTRPMRRGEDLSGACDGLWMGMMIVDGQMKVRYANGAAAILLSAVREKMLGAEAGVFIGDADALSAVKAATHGEARVKKVVHCPGSAGSETVLRFTARTIGNNDQHLGLVVIEDVTQLRIAEQSRGTFVAQATHELRTPLTNMRLCLDELLEAPSMDEQTRANYINIVSQESRRLERLVGDMLSISEIEAGTLKVHTGDVRTEQLLAELKRDFDVQAREKGIKLVFNLPPKLPVLQGDRDKIVLGIGNLIGNALKYTLEGGEVNVSVKTVNAVFSVDVADTGIGITPEEQEKVFEKFYRAKDQRVEKITGTGLGLSLARQIARLHGGDVTLVSQLNKGSTFTFSMPMMAQRAAAA